MRSRKLPTVLEHLLAFIVIASCALIHTTFTMPTAEIVAHPIDETQLVVIQEDNIPDIDNTTQKIIRVNPLELPAIRDDQTGTTDSELFKIKTLMPTRRKYTNSKRVRRPRIQMSDMERPAPNVLHIIREKSDGKFPKSKHQQLHKKKQLHFLYNQETLDGRSVIKRMRVRIAPGAYPIYYAVSKTNGRFGKFPIKGFNNERDFMKYLVKSKLDPIDPSERYES